MFKARKGTNQDIEEILALQKQNLYGEMSETERENGFVTTPISVAQIEQALALNGVFVAENENKEIISYVFAANWDYYSQWEIFNYMVSRFPQLSFDGREITTTNSFQYGPICIEKNHRGQGVIRLVFEKMRLELSKHFPTGITFINKVNIPSTKAHLRLGWKIIDEFQFNNNNDYLGLAFDMQQSVRLNA